MNKLLKPAYLPYLAPAAGVVGLLLRIWLFSTNVDSTGYLVLGHPAQVLLWVLTVGVLLVLFFGTRALPQVSKYSFLFPASAVGGIGCCLGGFSLVIVSILSLTAKPDGLTAIVSIMGLVSAMCLLLIGYNHWYGQRSHPILHAVICIFLMLRLVCQYRHWCSDPQTMDYCFQLLATVFLMLASYHRTAFSVKSGKRSSYVFYHLAAVYFCLLSLWRSDSFIFYFGTGVWMCTDLCNLSTKPKRKPEEG